MSLAKNKKTELENAIHPVMEELAEARGLLREGARRDPGLVSYGYAIREARECVYAAEAILDDLIEKDNADIETARVRETKSPRARYKESQERAAKTKPTNSESSE